MTGPHRARVNRVRAAAGIASLALQQIEDNLSADDVDQEELAAILGALIEDTDPPGGLLAAVAQLLTAAARRAEQIEPDHVVVADNIHRLEPLLRQASDTRRRELGWDGGDGLGDLLLVRRTFGSEVLPLWHWCEGSPLAGGDRVGEIRLGPDRLVLALRTDVGCPYDDCDAPAWQPVFSVTDLWKAHTSDTGLHPDAVCSVHGGPDDVDQEADDHDQDDDPEGRADLEEQFAAAVRE
ncbi:hypothetical protein [Streptomyces sp. NRRL F-5630]|uniref:hypothetical protein n=1 Tax=Streptomyces sp. NRRL F-5630 TaxID=1463864 RepID=UPI000A502E41|nr:hypothetical protein [Streptomyces sp. NRRL F-5630]